MLKRKPDICGTVWQCNDQDQLHILCKCEAAGKMRQRLLGPSVGRLLVLRWKCQIKCFRLDSTLLRW